MTRLIVKNICNLEMSIFTIFV